MPNASYNEGMTHFRNEKFANASDAFGRAAAADPTDPRAHYMLGHALRSLNRDDEALPHFREAVRLDPANASMRVELGHVLRALKREEEGLLELRRATELEPTSADTHFSLGLALRWVNRFPEAIESLERSIELGPDRLDHYDLLVKLLIQESQFGRALVVARRAIAVQERKSDDERRKHWIDTQKVYRWDGEALLGLGRPGEALRSLYRAAVCTRFPDVEIAGLIAQSYFGLNRWNEAASFWESALRSDRNYFDHRTDERRQWEKCLTIVGPQPPATWPVDAQEEHRRAIGMQRWDAMETLMAAGAGFDTAFALARGEKPPPPPSQKDVARLEKDLAPNEVGQVVEQCLTALRSLGMEFASSDHDPEDDDIPGLLEEAELRLDSLRRSVLTSDFLTDEFDASNLVDDTRQALERLEGVKERIEETRWPPSHPQLWQQFVEAYGAVEQLELDVDELHELKESLGLYDSDDLDGLDDLDDDDLDDDAHR